MGKIYLIGGGDIQSGDTKEIDSQFLEDAGGESARLLFFPTAAYDNDGYIEAFSGYFSGLGCQNVESGKLSVESGETIKGKIDRASGIYLGGGSTEELIRAFRASGIINHLVSALEKGLVLAGMSAGAMCLGKVSVLSEIEEEVVTGPGLGILDGVIPVAHYRPELEGKFSFISIDHSGQKVIGIPERSACVLDNGGTKHIGQIFEI